MKKHITLTEHLLMGGGLALIVAATHTAEHGCDTFQRVEFEVADAIAQLLLSAALDGAL